jgi:hypothetical protein
MPERIDKSVWKAAETAVIEGNVARLVQLLREHPPLLKEEPTAYMPHGPGPDYAGGTAREIVVREHHFRNFEEFSTHLMALKNPDDPVTQFEAAVDAVIDGHLPKLEKLLRGTPELIRARSPRIHHSTLLHYLGANGVEGWRQKTPCNALEVMQVLLEAGADVDAEAGMYGGASTTLELVATSIHPWRAGLVERLIDTLLEHGAKMRGPGLVNACLANGRPWAAFYLTRHKAPLDLEAAAGVGRLDLVESFFAEDGRLKNATSEQMHNGFAWACEYGLTDSVAQLLNKGMPINARVRNHGQTGLHWAAYGAHQETLKLLLQRGADVNAKDESFHGTPLGWALYGWSEGVPGRPRVAYPGVVSLLVEAGGKVEAEWLAVRGIDEKIRSDAEMAKAMER